MRPVSMTMMPFSIAAPGSVTTVAPVSARGVSKSAAWAIVATTANAKQWNVRRHERPVERIAAVSFNLLRRAGLAMRARSPPSRG